MKKHADFWQVTQDALDYALDVFNITDQQLRNDLINAYLELECYPEVPETLAKLKDSGRQIANLSNGRNVCRFNRMWKSKRLPNCLVY